MTASEDVPLRQYVERILDEREKALNLAFKAQQEALRVASASLDRELEHLNNLREDVVTKTYYDTKHEALVGRIGAVERFNAYVFGFGAALSVIAGIVGGVVGHKFGF